MSIPREFHSPSLAPRLSRTCFVIVSLVLLGWGTQATAQVSAVGASNSLASAATRGTDIACDPTGNVCLVVGANGNGWGVFTNGSGTAASAPFRIDSGGGVFVHFPRVVYSPDASNGAGGTGAFLVTWTQNHAPAPFPIWVHGRFVSRATGGTIGSERIFMTPVGGAGAWDEAGSPVAYSPISHEFLVVWQDYDTGANLRAQLLDLNGQPIGSAFAITSDSAKSPSVAWNPINDEFAISYTGTTATWTNYAGFARISKTGAVLRAGVFDTAIGTYITDIAYNPVTRNYVVVYYASPFGLKGAEFNANGDLLAAGLISTTTGTYDGAGLAYNAASRTFLLAGQSTNSYDIYGAQLNSHGARSSPDTRLTYSNAASYYPRVAGTTAGNWNVSFAFQYMAIYDQAVHTTTTDGGSTSTLNVQPPHKYPSGTPVGGSFPPNGCPLPDPYAGVGGGVCLKGHWYPPGTVTPSAPEVTALSTRGCTTPDPFTVIGGGTCVNGGWVPNTAIGSSAPTDGTFSPPAPDACTSPDPFIAIGGGTCVNGGWLPPNATSSTGTATVVATAAAAGTVSPPGAGPVVPIGTSTVTDGTCSSPDPFLAIGGGICSLGGWRPRI